MSSALESFATDEAKETARPGKPSLPLAPSQQLLDWRTIDPETIQGAGVLVEELLCFQNKIEELMRVGAGRRVLIVGHDIIGVFDDLETAADYATERYPGRPVLIKKVAYLEPIHTLGGAILGPISSVDSRPG